MKGVAAYDLNKSFFSSLIPRDDSKRDVSGVREAFGEFSTLLNRYPNSRYAQDIMNQLMESDKEARDRPEYLDTWANTYAANGDFKTAIEVQQRAIKKAQEQQRNDVLEILRRHLDLFRAGNHVIDQVP